MQFTDNIKLTSAVGRVAIESSLTDDLLREILSKLYSGDYAWIFAEGQGTDWLIKHIKAVLPETNFNHRFWPASLENAFVNAIGELNPLRELRNNVIHGVWAYQPVDENDVQDRPWGNWDNSLDSEVFILVKSRQRTIFTERMFSVSDVVRLADEYSANRKRIVEAYRQLHRDRLGPPYEILPRW